MDHVAAGGNCVLCIDRLLMMKLLVGEQPCLCLDELASVGFVVAKVTLQPFPWLMILLLHLVELGSCFN